MKKLTMLLVTALLTLEFSGFANAVTVNTYDWNYGEDSIARITEIFYPAGEISGSALDLTRGMTDNLFLYSVRNLSSDFFLITSGVSNPDNIPGVMFSPAGWDRRSGTQDFEWDSPNPLFYILPGRTVSGFELFSPGNKQAATSYNMNQIGWVEFMESGNALSCNLFGPVSGPDGSDASVPEPATLLLLGSGLIGFAFIRKRCAS